MHREMPSASDTFTSTAEHDFCQLDNLLKLCYTAAGDVLSAFVCRHPAQFAAACGVLAKLPSPLQRHSAGQCQYAGLTLLHLLHDPSMGWVCCPIFMHPTDCRMRFLIGFAGSACPALASLSATDHCT